MCVLVGLSMVSQYRISSISVNGFLLKKRYFSDNVLTCCPLSDCLRLRFSVTDFVRLTNYYIIIIIIIIVPVLSRFVYDAFIALGSIHGNFTINFIIRAY